MNYRTCSIEGCGKRYKGRGYCNPHYQRLLRTGDPLGSTPRPSTETLFWAKVVKTDTCWLWDGNKTDEGYGRVTVHNVNWSTHRYSWFLASGEIPDGKVIDHRCLNESCVRPSHLRLATIKQNNEHRRGAMKKSKTGVRGVTWREDCNKYLVSVGHNKRKYHVGMFESLDEATQAAIAKRNELFTHNDLDRVQG